MIELMLSVAFSLPLIGGLLSFVLKNRFIPSIFVGFSFLIAILLIISFENATVISWEWIPGMEVGILIDKVALILISLVAFVSLLVHVFSIKYMSEDQGVFRYFAKLGFFVFSMIGLLMVDHLILLFVFWELVGVSSYLLIGFWYSKGEVPASARTAFMVNRIADACLLAGILLLYGQTGELSFSKMDEVALFFPSLLVAIGAFGKSAQVPFSGWLTKAMVGPTPVSALIHAATMVAAGVYLLFRFSPYIDLDVQMLIAIMGSATAFYGGLCALNQFDIKKILAYSTISQLGYMMIGIGVGARDASLFHLFTHAFFKAGLFLAAASIIHHLHEFSKADAQDIRVMGGLKKRLPWTFRSFLLCGLALAGVPFFSGFFSKDAIIVAAWSWASELGTWAYIIPDLALLTVLLTAFYVGRAILLMFSGKPRIELETTSNKESWLFVVPLIILSVFSIWIFHNLNPLGHEHWLINYWEGSMSAASSFIVSLALILSLILVSAGFSLSYAFFKPGSNYAVSLQAMKEPEGVGVKWTFNGFYLTNLYTFVSSIGLKTSRIISMLDKKLIDPFLNFSAISAVVFSKVLALVDRFMVDGPVNWIASLSAFIGKRFAGLSSRDLQTQLIWLMFIVILILGWIILF